MAKVNGNTVSSIAIKNKSGTTLGTLSVTDETSSVRTGTFTPTESASSVEINTGLASISGFVIKTTAKPVGGNYSYRNCAYIQWDEGTSWAEYLTTNSTGTTYQTGGHIEADGTTSPIVVNGGTITISQTSTWGYLAPQEFTYYAW